MSQNLPKILFIADEIPQSVNAGSIQFYRLFQHYPQERLMVFGREPLIGAKLLDCEYHTLKMPVLDRIRLSRFMPYLTDLQSIGLALPQLPKRLKKIADGFKPDIVISLMQLLPFYYVAYHYSQERKIPFILFCHDDVEDFARPHQLFKKPLVKLNSKIYQSASKRICISPEMAEAWKVKYLAKGDFMYPTASENIRNRSIYNAEELVQKKTLTLGYAGSLAYGYREGINEIIDILERTNTTLRIYRNIDKDITKSSAIEFAGYANTPEETWLKIIEECDAVILPYSQSKKFEKLYRTHFPSKLAEYVALQMPIIVCGPDYANGMKWSKTKNGILAGSIIDLQNIFSALLVKENRLKYVTHIKDIKDFDSSFMLKKFNDLIKEISTEKNG